MKINEEIVKAAEIYVSQLLKDINAEIFHYHTLQHTVDVVNNATDIAKNEGFSEHKINIVKIAAWFHDTGYLKKYVGHEAESAQIAEIFLTNHNADTQDITEILSCILATEFSQNPSNETAAVLCDADFLHLASENYEIQAEKLRKERNLALKTEISKLEFLTESLVLFEEHSFFTNYCKNEFNTVKNKNLKLIKSHLFEIIDKTKLKQTKNKDFTRGVDSMFKITARNQINLSQIADNKSNILISLNGIIISLTLTILISRFKQDTAFLIPTIIFIIFSLITIVLAILSLRPNISTGIFLKDEIKKKKVNLLFFGNFFNMKYDDYEWAVNKMIKDSDYLHSALIKDQYSLGIVLSQKYKLLRRAYNVFMAGIVISVLSFLYVLIFLR